MGDIEVLIVVLHGHGHLKQLIFFGLVQKLVYNDRMDLKIWITTQSRD